MSATFTVSPERGLVDAPVSIRLDGLTPRAAITIRARVEVPERSTWTSSAIVLADAEGSIDLDQLAPLFGDYLVPDAEGLIWSLRPSPDSPVHQGNSRFIDTGLEPYDIVLTAEHRGAVVATARLTRVPLAPDVTRLPVRDRGLVATLFTPPGTGPHPLVLVVPGSDGGIPEHLAALYASHGWAALALAYFNAEHLPATLTEIPIEYFETALSWIADNPVLEESRILLNGTSRGGELALLLGSLLPEITSVLAWVPSLYVNGGMGPQDAELGRTSWTRGGEPLPFLPRGYRDESQEQETREGHPVYALGAVRALEDRERFRPFEIEVERINGPILFVSGRDDLLWPSDVYSRWAIERLAEHDFAHPVTHLSYPNAGHSVGPRANPATVLATSPLPGSDPANASAGIHLGGNPQGIAAARQDLWPQVLAFVAEQLAVPDRITAPGTVEGQAETPDDDASSDESLAVAS